MQFMWDIGEEARARRVDGVYPIQVLMAGNNVPVRTIHPRFYLTVGNGQI